MWLAVEVGSGCSYNQHQNKSYSDLLEEEMAARSSVLAWEIPRPEEPGGLQSMGLQRVKHD